MKALRSDNFLKGAKSKRKTMKRGGGLKGQMTKPIGGGGCNGGDKQREPKEGTVKRSKAVREFQQRGGKKKTPVGGC